jgi:hypothetical protein
MPKRRLFTRRSRAPSFFGVVVLLALLGASVLALAPAHAPPPGQSHLQAQAATVATPAPATTVAAAPVAAPRFQPQARSSLQIFACTGQSSCRLPKRGYEAFAPPP